MSDLEELFSRLKPQQQQQPRQSNGLADSRVASIWENQAPASPSPAPQDGGSSAAQTPARQVMPRGATEQSMSNNLLTLLNINRPQISGNSQRAASAIQSNGNGASPFEPVSLARKPSESAAFPSRLTSDTAAVPPEPPANTQRFLLDLLTKPAKPAEHSQQPLPKTPDLTKTDQAAIDRLAQSFAAKAQVSSKPTSSAGTPKVLTPQVQTPQPGKSGLFTYVNPFDQLHASSPLNVPKAAAPKQEKEPSPASPKFAAEEKTPISVAEKLEQVGEQIGKDADQALAQATKSKDEEVNSNWSTAEDEDAKMEEEDQVEAYNFPMRPFVMLELKQTHTPRPFRSATWTNATPVARLKKEFSHDDRTLATASQSHILYAVVPTEKKPASGLKVIRQDDGKNKHIWSDTNERLCSVQVASASTGSDAVLATGINGTIFYTELADEEGAAFDATDLEAQGFIMTPPPNSDEPGSSTFATSSAIRTRAKLSNRRPEAPLFAVARGRQIHLISPALVKSDTYTDVKTRRVDTDKLLSDASFSINSGKAGKDFCFSEDDSILASLDKVGKIKLWDIRPLTEGLATSGMPSKLELKDPLVTFAAGAVPRSPDDKMSPSSILFLDKDKPYTKGVAQRYLLVGYQQNQILQLWDICLGSCVQELRFPQSAEVPDGSSKGMCSISYHPKSATICVGHPGRNSIYFINLSSPKYNLAPMDQATFLSHVARGDTKNVPRPDSTAIMSGVREFSCARVGQLRSLDILKTPFTADAPATDNEVLFELYLMHSKGVLGIPISRADLGCDAKGKFVKPADAIERGVVTVHDLKAPAQAEEKSIASEVSSKSKSRKEEVKPAVEKRMEQQQHQQPPPPVSTISVPAASETQKVNPPQLAASDKSKPSHKSQNGHTRAVPSVEEKPTQTSLPVITPASYKMTAPPQERASSSTSVSNYSENELVDDAVSNKKNVGDTASKNVGDTASKKVGNAVSKDVADTASKNVGDIATNQVGDTASKNVGNALSEQFASLYAKLETDRRVADAAGAAKQNAILNLISSTLTDNVETSLHTIVSSSIEQKVLPVLTSQVLANVDRSLSQSLQKLLPEAVQQQVKASIPEAVNTGLKNALQETSFVRSIATEVAKHLGDKVKTTVQSELQQFQTSLLAKIDAQHAETKSTISKHIEQTSTQAKAAQKQSRDVDQSTLKALRESEDRITQILSAMQTQQAQLAAKIETMQQTAVPDTPQTVRITPEESPEVRNLTELLNAGNFEQATIEWLQSSQQAELFDDLFVRINPAYLKHVSPLVALSVSAAVTSSFDSNVDKRLEWLSSVLDNMDTNDSEIRDVIPKIMDVLIQRLQGAYMQIAESKPDDQEVLRKLASLNREIGEVRRGFP